MNRYVSVIPQLHWPAFVGEHGSRLLAIQFQLAQSERLTRAELRSRQILQLQQVLRHAYDTTQGYRDWLDGQELPPGRIRSGDDWYRLGTLSRQQVQLAGELLFSTAPPASHGRVFRGATSGSTGRPLLSLGTDLTNLMWEACLLREHLWHGRDFAGALAAIVTCRQSSNGEVHQARSDDGWGPGTDGVLQTGRRETLDIHTPLAEQAKWLMALRPKYLLSYASNVAALARWFLLHGQRLDSLHQVRTRSEVVDQDLRDLCCAAWNAKVVDTYSANEIGYIATQCPQCDLYHVQAENVLVEVLSDSGFPCRAGEVGRVVITTLNNFAMPLIRYEIGDLAEVGEPCVCGRGLPTLSRIWGRQRQMIRLPDGTWHWPSLRAGNAADIDEFPPILQYQLIQHTVDELEVLLHVARPLSGRDQDVVRRWVCAATSDSFRLTITMTPEIPRSASGKYHDVVCKLTSHDDP